MKENGGSEFT